MVVLDTSVAYKWFSASEIHSDLALNLLHSHLIGKNKIFVPDLLLYELANAWSTKSMLSIGSIKDNLEVFRKYRLNIIPVTLDLIKKAIELSKSKNISVYDATYAVLAREKRCNLITADTKFEQKMNMSFIKTLSNYSR